MVLDSLEKLCRKLLEYDPDIVEIVHFGSSIYAPQYAKDVDLLVITRRVKDYSGYLDAVNMEDTLSDVLVFKVGEAPRQDLLRGILGAFKILYGDGRHLLKYAETLSDPTFEEAESSLRVAASLMKLALETANPLDKDRLFREAFDSLFHAARIASMVHLSTDIGRWGLIRRELPEPYKTKFSKFINTLHIKYFYNGEYPKEKVGEEFDAWFHKVKEYIEELESEIKRR